MLSCRYDIVEPFSFLGLHIGAEHSSGFLSQRLVLRVEFLADRTLQSCTEATLFQFLFSARYAARRDGPPNLCWIDDRKCLAQRLQFLFHHRPRTDRKSTRLNSSHVRI